MTDIDIWYEGDLSTRCVQIENKAEIWTDAPKDNQGLGRLFSPTDLVGAALGSCVLTLMGIAARKLRLDLMGTRVRVSKEMQAGALRRIGALRVEIFCPLELEGEIQSKLIQAAETCPVHHSLNPAIVITYIYHWGQK